jgi:hypothetical protein
VFIEDIALGLSRTYRYYGQTRLPITVAQHSVLVSKNVPFGYALLALLHDASEYAMGDVASPLKRLLAPIYGPLERGVMNAIWARFGLTEVVGPGWGTVHVADQRAFATETRDLRHGSSTWPMDYPPFEERIGRCWGPDEAEGEFLKEFGELWNG